MFLTFDTTYFWYVFIPTMLLSVGVQIWLRRTYSKWHKVENSSDLTGKEVTDVLFDDTTLEPIPVRHIRGNLTDHYDPGKNVVNLSDAVYDEDSVAAMAVAAHELGHVQQYQTDSTLIKMRGFLIPAVTLSPTVSYACLILGLLFNMTNLLWVGIFFFSLTILFSLLTLPVETNASRRALAMLDETGLRKTDADIEGSKKVLRAAAMTYLAAAVSSVITLLYYFSRVREEAQRDKARDAQREKRQQQSSQKKVTSRRKASSTKSTQAKATKRTKR
ncbi:MAG: zinc metallopeptidase [Candidatus Promineifilaceae bacterium]